LDMLDGDGRGPSLDAMRKLMEALGNPQRRLRAVHVAGTNGKGSTAAMCAQLLSASDLKVGLFTGPHLSRVYDRITVNGAAISDADLSSALCRVQRAALRVAVQPTRSEAMAAAALVHFDRCRVDAAVIEGGMLGRWDATNVVDADVTVVTNVGSDHAEIEALSAVESLLQRRLNSDVVADVFRTARLPGQIAGERRPMF
jgi:dihydrofolate synthase/folylpolyglutamate synthase